MGLVEIITFLQGLYTLTFFPVPMVSPLLLLNVFVKTGFSHTPPNVALMTIPLSGVLTHFGWETFTVMEHLKDLSYTLGVHLTTALILQYLFTWIILIFNVITITLGLCVAPAITITA